MTRKIWDNTDSKLPLVVEYEFWRFIHNFSDLKSFKGVFIFADSSHKVKYVGNTINNDIVEAVADAIADGKDFDSTLVKALYTQIDTEAELLANILKEKYSPRNNSLDLKPVSIIETGTNRVI